MRCVNCCGGGSGGGGGGGGPRPTHGSAIEPQTAEPAPRSSRQLLAALEELLNDAYKLEVFAPGSTSFRLPITYRQKWEPITKQVGDLARTLTLAPREKSQGNEPPYPQARALDEGDGDEPPEPH